MYTNRRRFVAKRGRAPELIELFKSSEFPPVRIYGPTALATGDFDTVIVEQEFESLSAYEETLSGWLAAPSAASFQETLDALTETGGTNELLKHF